MMMAILTAALVSSEPLIENEKAWASSLVSAISGGGAFGWMRLEIVVDQGGKPVDCQVPKASAGPSFKSRACAVAMRSHYKPAHDESGNAVAGVLTYSIGSGGYDAAMAAARIDAVLTVDRLPADIKSHVSSVHLITDPSGRIESCTIGKSSGSAALDKAACTYLTASSFAPVLDAGGAAIRAFRSASVAFLVPPTPDK